MHKLSVANQNTAILIRNPFENIITCFKAVVGCLNVIESSSKQILVAFLNTNVKTKNYGPNYRDLFQ